MLQLLVSILNKSINRRCVRSSVRLLNIFILFLARGHNKFSFCAHTNHIFTILLVLIHSFTFLST